MEESAERGRVLGIVGGTGPESTVDYYRSLVATWRRRRPDGSYPRIIINSIEAGRIFRYLADADFVVGFDGDRSLLERLNGALQSPKWPLCLGRKSFVPALPVWCGPVREGSAIEVLKSLPWVCRYWNEKPPQRFGSGEKKFLA